MRNRIVILSILAVVSVACTGKKQEQAPKTATTKADVSKEKALADYRAKKRAAEAAASENEVANPDTRTLPKKAEAPKSTVAVTDPNAPKKVFKVEVLPDGTVRSIPTASNSTSVDPVTGKISNTNSSAAELAKRMLRQNAGFDPDAEIRVKTSVTTTEVATTAVPTLNSARFVDFDKLVGRYQVAQKIASLDVKEVPPADGFEVEILSDYTLHVYVKSTDCEANIVFRVVRADGQNLSLDMQSYEPSVQNGSACDPIKVFLPDTNTDKDISYKRAANGILLEYDGGYIPLVVK